MRYRKPAPKSLSSVIRAYRASAKFQDLAPKTRRGYDFGFLKAEAHAIGEMDVDEIRLKHIQAFLDKFDRTPAVKMIMRSAFCAMEDWALRRELMSIPIMHRTEAEYESGSHEPWTDTQVRLAETHARPDLGRLITLGANTGQRGSDLVRMKWLDIEEYQGHPGINVIQQKTAKRLWVPFTAELITAMAGWDRSLGYLITKPTGQPYTRQHLSDAWLWERDHNPALTPLKDAGLVLHGLRATAVVRMRRANVSEALIADFVGMSPRMVHRYCRASEQRANAMAALHRMAGTEAEPNNVVTLKKPVVSD